MPPDLLTLDPAASAAMPFRGVASTDLADPIPSVLPDSQFSLDLSSRDRLSAVRERVEADDRGKRDLVVARHELLMQQGKLTLPESYEDEFPTCLTLSPWARSQACQRLGIPAGYFGRCWAPLQDAQFNHWLWRTAKQDDPPDWADDEAGAEGPDRTDTTERWLLRCKGSEARAVLSSRYAPLDNRALLDALTPLVERRFEVKGLSLTPESLHLRLVDPHLAREVLPDDRLLVGLHIANSEVGARAVTVDALVYRLVCTNGLIRLVNGRSLLHRRHIWRLGNSLPDALERAVGEAVTAGAGLLERLAWATQAPVPHMERTLETLGKQWDLTQETQKALRQALLITPPSQQETVYGLVNALTLAAQSLPPDGRYHLEARAGRLLDHGLPRQNPTGLPIE